jgi:outer membrane protein assembly factor BamB
MLALIWLFGAPAAVAQSPKDVFDATGVKGGLVVHLGCGDGKLTAGLLASESYLVHGLDIDAANVQRAREYIESLGIYGKVSVETFDGKRLPYVDNLVSLVVAEDLGGVSMDEVKRVLCPDGVAYVKQGDRWTKTIKPRPGEIDEWTHFLHDAGGNAVAKDSKVGPPRRIQWTAGPKRSRDHDCLASMSAMTSSGGRIFYIYDEGPTSLIHRPPQWRLIARDALNGVLLWKREIGSWVTPLYFFRSGPVQMPRRLVSIGQRVYVTLGLEAPVTALDAATGRTLMTFKGSEKTEEIICHDDVLLAVVGDPSLMNREAPKVYGYWELSVDRKPEVEKALVAYKASTGEVLWRRSAANLAHLVPLSLSAEGDRAFFLDNEKLSCIDLRTGGDLWQASCPTRGLFLRSYAPTVVVHDDVALCLTLDTLAAFRVEDGKKLWEHKGYLGFGSPGDLFVIDGLAWTLPMTASIWSGNRRGKDGKIATGIPIPTDTFLGSAGSEFWGIDVRTGSVVKTFPKKAFLTSGHHHRCYRNKATERYLLCGRRGLELIDLEGDDHEHNWWIRGVCQYGLMPANGLIYVPPDPCKCFNLIKFDGFCALASKTSLDTTEIDQPDRLTKGPAYAAIQKRGQESGVRGQESGVRGQGSGKRREPAGEAAKARNVAWSPPIYDSQSDEWPTYRHDITRSSSTKVPVPATLRKVWSADLGGPLSSAVVAQRRLLVNRVDAQTVACLDARSGKTLWQFVADGQVDSPPTVYDGLAVFGCGDGSVYCLRAADGQLVWRFRGAPVDRRIVADNRLESVWPVHGSVLVLDGVVYFAAGRSSFLDGGIRLYGLDVHSGRTLHETTVAALPPRPDRKTPGEKTTGALPDVLVSDGKTVNMRHVQFDPGLIQRDTAELKTLVTTTGFLEDAWEHRLNWHLGYAQKVNSHANAGSIRANRRTGGTPYGKLLAFDDQCAYGVQSLYTFLKHTPQMHPPTHDGHKHQKYSRYKAEHFPVGVRIYARQGTSQKWTMDAPLQVRAMVLADRVLFLAGWRDSVGIEEGTGMALSDETEEEQKAVLWAVSAEDGKRLAEYELSSQPVFDGMIAAAGRLYIALKDGTVLCMGPDR